MQAFPHRYTVRASAASAGEIELSADRLTALHSAPPAEFGGPGDRWSPETLLVAALADCFILTFRAIARASHLPWIALDCAAAGTLDRVEGVPQFTAFTLTARLKAGPGVDIAQTRRALERAERGCLISNSLKAQVHLQTQIDVVEPVECPAAG